MSAPSRKRQGNPQLGIEICTHICGCVFPENAVRKLRRKPIWLRHCPVFLRDGGHSRFHIQNSDFHPQCNQACVVLDGKARSLTREEYHAWVPHLGHLKDWHPHIPKEYHSLVPTTPLGENYDDQGLLPAHPLKTNPPPSQPVQTILTEPSHSIPTEPAGSTPSPHSGPSTSPLSWLTGEYRLYR